MAWRSREYLLPVLPDFAATREEILIETPPWWYPDIDELVDPGR
jgi:hypothetical protein